MQPVQPGRLFWAALAATYAAAALSYGVAGAQLLVADRLLSQQAFAALSAGLPLWASLGYAGSVAAWLLVCGSLYWKRHRRAAALLFIGVWVELALTLLLKSTIDRPRPAYEQHVPSLEPETGWSMPSGHTQRAFMAATVLGGFFIRARLPLFIFAAAIAVSRVALGAHWLLDVAVGAVNGIALGGLILRLPAERIKRRLGIK